MLKKLLSVLLTCIMIMGIMAGCGSNNEESSSTNNQADTPNEKVTVKVGSLKGATSMGIVSLMDNNANETAANNYEFTMVTAADELLTKVVSGELDIALVPANVASVLYNKTEGKVSVININTLGVLYIVTGDESIKTLEDLKGKTLYLTGKGTTPDYVIQYLLEENGLLDDVTLEYKSEATEIAALLKESPESVGLLPQPFATVACTNNERLEIVIDLTEQWDSIQGDNGSKLVTGVTIVRNEFLEKNEEAVKTFMTEHQDSADFTNTNVEKAAELIVATGIIEKAPIAVKAIPYCSITYIDGNDMKNALSGYLEVLFNREKTSIGGKLPTDDFYYMP